MTVNEQVTPRQLFGYTHTHTHAHAHTHTRTNTNTHTYAHTMHTPTPTHCPAATHAGMKSACGTTTCTCTYCTPPSCACGAGCCPSCPPPLAQLLLLLGCSHTCGRLPCRKRCGASCVCVCLSCVCHFHDGVCTGMRTHVSFMHVLFWKFLFSRKVLSAALPLSRALCVAECWPPRLLHPSPCARTSSRVL